MGPLISALVQLQSIELDLTNLRRRKRVKDNAVNAQQAKINQHTEQLESVRANSMERRKRSDELDLDLRASEEHVEKLRVDLNSAKTNKEYATLLTQINSLRADNAKVEDEGLKVIAEIEALKQQITELEALIAEEGKKLTIVQDSSKDEIAKLDTMIADLTVKRDDSAGKIPPKSLAIFDRIASNYDGEAMAQVEVSGRKQPYSYSCGGCYMSLNAEHANALKSHDAIRQCDNCKRILYMDETA
ncbi:MAG: hypothetical protein KAR11_02365 [Phycisphaerae bacterium]|nr:hypothetical protein [Phycisphaerae bacterium]